MSSFLLKTGKISWEISYLNDLCLKTSNITDSTDHCENTLGAFV